MSRSGLARSAGGFLTPAGRPHPVGPPTASPLAARPPGTQLWKRPDAAVGDRGQRPPRTRIHDGCVGSTKGVAEGRGLSGTQLITVLEVRSLAGPPLQPRCQQGSVPSGGWRDLSLFCLPQLLPSHVGYTFNPCSGLFSQETRVLRDFKALSRLSWGPFRVCPRSSLGVAMSPATRGKGLVERFPRSERIVAQRLRGSAPSWQRGSGRGPPRRRDRGSAPCAPLAGLCPASVLRVTTPAGSRPLERPEGAQGGVGP